MTSQINEDFPAQGKAYTTNVRSNFSTAKAEISALQAQTGEAPFLALAGGSMTGPMYLYNDPTDVMMPATKGYVGARRQRWRGRRHSRGAGRHEHLWPARRSLVASAAARSPGS